MLAKVVEGEEVWKKFGPGVSEMLNTLWAKEFEERVEHKP
jgi:hypothetical protein